MNSNKRDIASADDKCHICNSEKREDGMCLCAESWNSYASKNSKRTVAELPKEAEGKETFDNLSTADKIKCVQGSKELLDAVKILRAAFDGCGLQSYIRFTYTFQDDKRFEITFMPNQHHEDYSNPLISKNQTD